MSAYFNIVMWSHVLVFFTVCAYTVQCYYCYYGMLLYLYEKRSVQTYTLILFLLNYFSRNALLFLTNKQYFVHNLHIFYNLHTKLHIPR